MNLKKIKNDFRVQGGLLVAATVLLYGLLINNLNLWTDEIYSVLMAKDSFKDMWLLLTTEDSKPPLYYLYLKGILALFPAKYEIWAAHFASVILLIAAEIFALTAVKHDYGKQTALWLAALIMLMPPSLWLAFEVRTYMFSSLFLLMAVIYGMRLPQTPQSADYVKFGVVSLCALYSHYYCAIFLAFLYAYILFCLIGEKKMAKAGKNFLITAMITAVLFAPWLYVPLQTGGEISKSWYVTKEFAVFSWQFFTNPFAPEILQSPFFIATTFCMSALSFIVLCGLFETKRISATARRLFKTAFFCFMGTFVLLFILSYIVRPMLTARYIKIFSLIWYLAAAVVLAHGKNLQKAFAVTAVIGFFFSYADIRAVSFDEGYRQTVDDIRQFLPNDQILIAFDNSNLFCEYYLPEYTCLSAVGAKGEILRRPRILKNLPLYEAEPADMSLSLSIYPQNIKNDGCRKYESLYRLGSSLTLCRLEKETVRQILQNSLHTRLKTH